MFLIHFIIKIVESIYFVHFSFNNFNNHHTGKAKVSESVFFHSRTPLTLDIIKIIGYKSQGSRRFNKGFSFQRYSLIRLYYILLPKWTFYKSEKVF